MKKIRRIKVKLIGKNQDNIDDLEQKDEIFGIENQDGLNPDYLIEENKLHSPNKNEEDKNAKYANYPEKMLELINRIRANPSSYSEIILSSINNIIINQDNDETKPKIIYKSKVKVALSKGEQAFHEAAEILKNMKPMPPLELKEEICVNFRITRYKRQNIDVLIRRPKYVK